MPRYIPGTTPTPERAEEARRIVKQLDDYDDTIEVWESKLAQADLMLRNAREAKQRLLNSIAQEV